MLEERRVVVAGQICLDVIPGLDQLGEGVFQQLFRPGRVITAGEAFFSTGGAVSNTGQALYRLGIPVSLAARIGDDPFGGIIADLVRRVDPALVEGLKIVPGDITAYTVIINPPGVDRIFLHCPGGSNHFGPEDVDARLLEEAALFHFGYPPVMRRMYTQGGKELVEMLRRARAAGAATSLDMCLPDPYSEGGRADWPAILRAALPYVDIFLPSLEEILYMLDRSQYERWTAQGEDWLAHVSAGLLSEVSSALLEMGARLVVIKLGSRGLYLHSAPAEALAGIGRAGLLDPAAWGEVELWRPCFQVQVAGTTGSGDATIAGFLAALLRGFSPRQAVTAAVGVGACSVEAVDALGGIRTWPETLARIEAGWPHLPLTLSDPGWTWNEGDQVWVGPAK